MKTRLEISSRNLKNLEVLVTLQGPAWTKGTL